MIAEQDSKKAKQMFIVKYGRRAYKQLLKEYIRNYEDALEKGALKTS